MPTLNDKDIISLQNRLQFIDSQISFLRILSYEKRLLVQELYVKLTTDLDWTSHYIKSSTLEAQYLHQHAKVLLATINNLHFRIQKDLMAPH